MSEGPWPPVERPITPDQALKAKINAIPSFVIEAVNELLAKRFSGVSCTIKQKEVIEKAEEIGMARGTIPGHASRQTFFNEHWLDFEPLFRDAGWKVEYDKPGWDESYEPFWKFSRAK